LEKKNRNDNKISNNSSIMEMNESSGGVLRSLSEASVVTVVENDGSLRAPPEGMETIIMGNLDGHGKQQRQNNLGINVM
jgi:hypothetical protein